MEYVIGFGAVFVSLYIIGIFLPDVETDDRYDLHGE